MLYMIGLSGIQYKKGYKNLIKIGYTKKVDKRLREYKTHNPIVIPMWSMAGGKAQEKYFQELLASYSLRQSYGEWYEVSRDMWDACFCYGFKIFTKQNVKQYNLNGVI